MSNSSTQRWVRYEQALLTALGCTAAEGHPERASYRLLVIPTFHPICACEYSFAERTATLRVAALPSVSNPLFDYFFGQQTQATEVSAIEEAMFSCLEATVDLTDPAQLRQRFISFARPEVDPRDLAARDGANLRLDLLDPHGRETLQAQVGLLKESTALAGWVAMLIDTALERIGDVRPAAPLKHARSYLLAS